MKRFYLVLIVISLASELSSQTVFDFGVNYSLSWSKFRTSSALENISQTKFSPLNFGLFVDMQPNAGVNPYFSLSSGVDYRQKRINDDDKLNSLEVPLMLNLRIPCIPHVLSLYASIGAYASYNFEDNVYMMIDVDNFNQNILDINKFGAGLKYSLAWGSPYSKFGLAIEYEQGLTNLLKENNKNMKLKTGTWYITIKLAAISGLYKILK